LTGYRRTLVLLLQSFDNEIVRRESEQRKKKEETAVNKHDTHALTKQVKFIYKVLGPKIKTHCTLNTYKFEREKGPAVLKNVMNVGHCLPQKPGR
jgi:hypothetical protein